jgi:phosphatidylglycerophosphate synthase
VLNQKIRGMWDVGMKPMGRVLADAGIGPNTITAAGVLVQAGAAWAIVADRLPLAGLLSIVAAVADTIDGAVAKARGETRRLGALLDSTADRMSDALFFCPVAWLYGLSPDPARRDQRWVAALALTALVLSFLVSYVKARAEGLGFECNVGIAERAERLILMILGLLLNLIPLVLVALAALAAITVVQRLLHVRKQARRGGERATS